MTSNGMTKKTITVNLPDPVAKDLQNLANSSTDFEDGCNTPGIADGTNASLLVSGKLKSRCANAATWPKGPHTTAFLKAINSNLPADFHVF